MRFAPVRCGGTPLNEFRRLGLDVCEVEVEDVLAGDFRYWSRTSNILPSWLQSEVETDNAKVRAWLAFAGWILGAQVGCLEVEELAQPCFKGGGLVSQECLEIAARLVERVDPDVVVEAEDALRDVLGYPGLNSTGEVLLVG